MEKIDFVQFNTKNSQWMREKVIEINVFMPQELSLIHRIEKNCVKLWKKVILPKICCLVIDVNLAPPIRWWITTCIEYSRWIQITCFVCRSEFKFFCSCLKIFFHNFIRKSENEVAKNFIFHFLFRVTFQLVNKSHQRYAHHSAQKVWINWWSAVMVMSL